MKLLTLGNSFTDSLAAYLPACAQSLGENLDFQRANFGGCSLERHWSYISAEENGDDSVKIYRGGSTKLRTILEGTDFDIITIQQASHKSWIPESFEPFAENIIKFFRKYSPRSEIVVQETWAYRDDDPRLLPDTQVSWGFDRAEMQRRASKNYRALAEKYGFRLIPAGSAIALWRAENLREKVFITDSTLERLLPPDLPPSAWDLAGNFRWQKDFATGQMQLGKDFIHLNDRGKYLQACVWAGFLFKKSPTEISFVPEIISDDEARALRDFAARVL